MRQRGAHVLVVAQDDVELDVLGHTAVHSPIWVQPPKPFGVLVDHVERTRVPLRLTLWQQPQIRDLRDWNNAAEPFWHPATYAPRRMQVAASNASSASALGTGDGVGVGGSARRHADVRWWDGVRGVGRIRKDRRLQGSWESGTRTWTSPSSTTTANTMTGRMAGGFKAWPV